MNYTTSFIASICHADAAGKDVVVEKIAFDSRQVTDTKGVMFISLPCRDACKRDLFVEELIQRGVCAFMVDVSFDTTKYNNNDVSFIITHNTLSSLHELAQYHRNQYKGEVVAIIGSNGKTIVKEWISQLWIGDKALFRSPKSYNSQIGVALSLLMIDREDVSLIEAGISQIGEMSMLEEITRPDIVIITNIGDAHSDNFLSLQQKLNEKLLMARNADLIIYNRDATLIDEEVNKSLKGKRYFTWGSDISCDVRLINTNTKGDITNIHFSYKDNSYNITIPFTDRASIENVMSAVSFYIATGRFDSECGDRCGGLQPVAMRLEMQRGVNGNIILNDSYNSDMLSVNIAINQLNNISGNRKSVLFLSDITQSGYNNKTLYNNIAEMVNGVDTLIGIGDDICRNRDLFKNNNSHFFYTTEQFLAHSGDYNFKDCAILLKGARKFRFERIAHLYEPQVHTTTLEVNLNNLSYNLNYYRTLIGSNVKCMAMVKALSYGSGSVEVAYELEKQHIDYLAVAYTDEGVSLRQGGIKAPIVVLNSEPQSFATMIEYNLEPEIYNTSSLYEFIRQAAVDSLVHYPIHIKIDTGMHRLGFKKEEVTTLLDILRRTNTVKIASLFSHFTSSDYSHHDNYTLQQIQLFEDATEQIMAGIDYSVMRHIANSAAIERFPQAHFDMVRLGIGLYGISPIDGHNLLNVNTLKSTIVNIQHYDTPTSVGYMRRGVLLRPSVIATIPIGYADGLSRSLSCGGWSVDINGHKAPITGNICMDACMIDITDIPDVKEGDSVTIFSNAQEIEEMAKKLNTIPYEILTRISTRVKRVYIKE